MLKLDEMFKRDIKETVNIADPTSKSDDLRFQVQNNPSDNKSARIVSVPSTQKDVCIFENKIRDKFTCTLLQYTLLEKDLEKCNYHMIGYLITSQATKSVIATLTLSFATKTPITNSEYTNGSYSITLSNSKSEKQVIETFDTYIGNDNAIYKLTDHLRDILNDMLD